MWHKLCFHFLHSCLLDRLSKNSFFSLPLEVFLGYKYSTAAHNICPLCYIQSSFLLVRTGLMRHFKCRSFVVGLDFSDAQITLVFFSAFFTPVKTMLWSKSTSRRIHPLKPTRHSCQTAPRPATVAQTSFRPLPLLVFQLLPLVPHGHPGHPEAQPAYKVPSNMRTRTCTRQPQHPPPAGHSILWNLRRFPPSPKPTVYTSTSSCRSLS